jgi:hypothetical protein
LACVTVEALASGDSAVVVYKSRLPVVVAASITRVDLKRVIGVSSRLPVECSRVTLVLRDIRANSIEASAVRIVIRKSEVAAFGFYGMESGMPRTVSVPVERELMSEVAASADVPISIRIDGYRAGKISFGSIAISCIAVPLKR